MAYTHGANTLILDLGANFEPIGAAPAGGEEYTNSVSRNRLGNFIAATNQQRNKISNAVQRYRAILPAGATVNVLMGGDGSANGGWIATRLVVRQTNTGDAILEITFHKNDGNSGLHLGQAFTVAIPSSGYGVTANPGSGGLADNCIGMEWTAEVGHLDKQDRVGDHLVGVSFGCLITCRQTYVDDEAAITAASGWFIDSDVPDDDNQNTRGRVVTFHTFQDADS